MITNYLKRNFVYCSLIIYGPLFGRQDHTSQDHFCSVIDEFPVWNSESDLATMMSRAASSEREKVWSLVMRCQTLMIARCPLSGSGGGRRWLSGFLEAKVFYLIKVFSYSPALYTKFLFFGDHYLPKY